MRIRGWRIDGFGIFHDAVVDDLPPGLTVVAGPNEAGKSTLLAFIRGVLFGFPDGRSRARRHEPVHGGRHGGSISIDADDGTWVVERYADPRALVLRRPDGSLAEDHELTDLLGHGPPAFDHPTHRTVLIRAATWAAGAPRPDDPARSHP